MALIYLLVKMVFSTVCLSYITQMKYSKQKSAVIITAVGVVVWLSNYAVYRIWGAAFLSSIFLLTASVPVYLCFILISKSQIFKVLFSSITVTIFGMPVSFIGQLVFYTAKSFYLEWAIEIVCYALLLLFVVKVFRKPYFRTVDTLDKGWGLLCTTAFLLLLVIYMLQYFPTPILSRPENIPVTFLVHVLTVVFYLIMYLNLENITQNYQLKHDRKLVTVQMDMYKKEYDALLDNINTMKIYRHDMRHYLTAIESLISNDNALEALNFIHQLSGSLGRTVMEQYCENYVVNVILSSYVQKAKKEQIQVNCEATVPQDIIIDPIELGLIFANAIENAINACKKNENIGDRFITIVSRQHRDQLYIRISNPCEGDVIFDGDYPVSEDAAHGTGTRSIAAIAQKNGGIFSFAARDGIFSTTVTLSC